MKCNFTSKPCSAYRVEKVLRECGAALVWVTHDPQQPSRVGGWVLELPGGHKTFVPRQPEFVVDAASADEEVQAQAGHQVVEVNA